MTTMVSTARVRRMRTAEGLRLHYRVLGVNERPDHEPPVIMLHGIMGHAREWDGLVEPLSARHRVVVPDQRGHGASDRAAEYSPAVLADDVVALIEHLGEPRVSVVGHSMGGMAALMLASRRPELVERLVVIDVGPDTVDGELALELRAFVAALGAASYASVDEAFAEWSDNPLVDPARLRHYVEHCLVAGTDGRLRWSFDGAGLPRFFDSVSASELWDAVDGVRCPALLIRGEHSPALSTATAEAMVRRFANGRLVVIAGGGHDLGVEQPAAVAAAVAPFLARSSVRPS